MTTVAHTRDTRRATVRRLAHHGMSQRAIAAELGVSKDTVRRDLAHDGAPDDAPDHAPDAPGAPQASTVLPGVHPYAVAAVAALRDINPDTLRHDARQARDTRPYLCATVRHAADLLAHTGPLDILDRLSVRHLADQLRHLADAD